MDFFININSTLPKLTLELINDGRDNFQKFFEKVQNANIYFTMIDVISGNKKICNKKAGIELVEPKSDCVGEQYYLVYQFSESETSKSGRYIGRFTIDFLDGSGTLIVPIRNVLYINILDNGIKK